MNEKNLVTQLFEININRDTTLLTQGGCIIKISGGSLESNSPEAKLEIKEALNIQDMVSGGLTTMSGSQNLSSGGMVYINAAEGYKISIKKALAILLPTKTFNPDMKVYKGVKDGAGKIDWQNSEPLTLDSTLTKIKIGENIFNSNCASCHKINDDFTGPSLYGVTYRRSKKWLYDFTRNPAATISADTLKDIYASCLFNTWKPTVMTAFPDLSNADLDNIYSYIKAETDKNPKANNDYGKTCCDSCELYRNELNVINNKREMLIQANEEFFNLDRTVQVPGVISPTFNTLNNAVDTSVQKKYVSNNSVKATYYTIKVEAFGWFNIDCLMKNYDDCKESELFVRIQGAYKLEYNVSLIIPSRKVFVEGGKLNDDSQYGFFESNGKITLPQNEQCYIIAFAEYNDKIIYGKASFISGIKQTILLNSKETSKENMLKQFASLQLNDLNLKVGKSKNTDEIIEADKKIDSLKKYLPTNCDCGLSVTNPAPAPFRNY